MKPLPLFLLLSSLSSFAAADPATLAETTQPAAVTESAQAWPASKVIGSSVKNSSGETIGKVADLIVDISSGRVLAMVVSTGGFLGLGDSLSSMPPASLKYDAASKAFITTLGKEELGKLPQTKSGGGGSAEDKMRAARNAIGGDVTAPDNTARNDKDLPNKALTPVDQGNSETDLKITKDIRSAVVGSDLSFNAKNIKIITRDGKVTLRGVVKNQAEKDAVVKLAKDHAGSAALSDELAIEKE